MSESSISENTNDSFLINLENFGNIIPNAIYTVDKNCIITCCNKKMLELTGYTSNELIGKNSRVITGHKNDILCEFMSKSQDKQIIEEICTIKRKNGEIVNAKKVMALLRNPEGEIIGGIESFTDITDIKTLNDELKEYRKKFELITESSNDLNIIFNSDFEIEYINENACFNITGYHAEEVLNQSATKFLGVENADQILDLFEVGIKKGEVRGNVRIIHKNGSYIWIEGTGKIYLDKDGKKKFFTISRDITKNRKYKKELKESEEHYKSKNKELKTLNRIIDVGNLNNNLDDYLTEILEIFTNLMDLDISLIYLFDNDKNQIVLKKHKGLPKQLISQAKSVDISNKYFQSLMQSKKALYIDDNRIIFPEFKESGPKSIIAAPINSEERFLGALIIFIKQGRLFSPNDLGLLLTIGDIIGTVVSRLQYEEKLMESEENFRLMMENINDSVAVCKKNFDYIYVNEANINTLKYSREEFLGIGQKKPMNALDLIHPDDIEQLSKDFLTYYFKQDSSASIEYRARRKDGTYIWLETRGQAFIDERGKKRVLYVSRDISDRKKAQEKIKESEQKFRNITEQSLFGIAILQENKYVYLNKAAEEILGYNHEEVLMWEPKEFAQLIHPDDKNLVQEQAHKKQTGKLDVINHYQYRLFNKAGNLRWIDNYSKTIIHENKKADLIIFNDITEKMEAELQLRDSEERYRLITENANDLITVTDLNLKIIYGNQAYLRILGYSNDEILGKDGLRFVHPDDIDLAVNAVQDGIKTGEHVAEIRIKHKKGNYLWFEIKGKIYKDLDGIDRILLVSRNVDEKKEVEEKLIQSEEKFRLIFENSPLGIVHFDKNGIITAANDSICDFVGLMREKVVGYNLLANLKNESMLQAIKKSLKGEKGYFQGEFTSSLAGKKSYLKSEFAPMLSKQGKL